MEQTGAAKPNALALLEVLAASNQPLSFADLRSRTGITPATLNRLLAKLGECDYVRKVSHGEYEAGSALVILASSTMENAAASPFRPLLRKLAMTTNHAAELYAQTPNGPVVVFHQPCNNPIRFALQPGHLIQWVWSHAAGRFFFARFPQAYDWRAKQLKELSIDIDELRRDVSEAVEQNFYIDRGRNQAEVARAAVATRDLSFCICLVGFVSDFPRGDDAKLRRTMQRLLKEFQPS